MTEVTEIRLTPAQKEMLQNAARRGGEVFTFGVQHRTIRKLRDAELIELRYSHTDAEREALHSRVLTKVIDARGSLNASYWHAARDLLNEAAKLERAANERKLYITTLGYTTIGLTPPTPEGATNDPQQTA
jgi:uncharacterized protein (DUF1778 family)